MKKIFQPLIFGLFFLGLWVYQLPISPFESALMKVFRPIQRVMFTNRQYQMYAPDARSDKNIPFLTLATDLTAMRFYKKSYSFLAAEKWDDFLDHLTRSLLGEWDNYPPEEGKAAFIRLADRICRDESVAGDEVRAVSLQYRPVHYGDFRDDIVWDPPEALETYRCR